MLLAHSARAQIYVLGVAQDGGYPHAGCIKKCCADAWASKDKRRYVTSLAYADSASGKWWLLEATPDIAAQLQYFSELTRGRYKYLPDGIFVTHAHIGHYTGLMQLGREVMNTRDMPVYVMPRMRQYLTDNGPWSQLVRLGNIKLVDIAQVMDSADMAGKKKAAYDLAPGVGVYAFRVPHRDEYSETVGLGVCTREKNYIFIPDIDKWEKWQTDIRNVATAADVVLIDGTFYRDGELPGRSMSEVPHPFVQETIKLFTEGMPYRARGKVHFIHFNHTNPLLWDTAEQQKVMKAGFRLAEQGEKL
ncbi:pyrroloquinoline quinone biosynthesis protein PqqB [Nemorincola caseinilytica]|uniref:Pyrroloquinoline quinone biosynthesis protein PqqB n=2 Tax=Nemorincola caseinilytica TaxID=2054315 RepID=A0ABP8N8G9_9BACT